MSENKNTPQELKKILCIHLPGSNHPINVILVYVSLEETNKDNILQKLSKD